MSGVERTLSFIRGGEVDRVPCHPIVMRWAAGQAGVSYRDFCLDYRRKCDAMIACAESYDLDWVTVLSDPWCEAEAFGIELEYPENDLPVDVGGHLASAAAVAELRPYKVLESRRTLNRINEIREFKRRCGDSYFIVGWIEGPVAEYADLRGVAGAALDLYDDPESVKRGMQVITDAAMEFVTLQVEAGAHAIGIGDAFCSQIGPEFYREFAWEHEVRLVRHIQECGAVAKLHICGNTTVLLPDMIRTGAEIVDVDHLVASMEPFAGLLQPGQVLSGKSDPVSIVQDSTPEEIRADVVECFRSVNGRCIVSPGCEITPGTSVENFRALREAAEMCL